MTEERRRQATLEAYFDWIAGFILGGAISVDENIEPARIAEPMQVEARSEPRRFLARARTVAAIRSLDGTRNSQLFAFLIASDLNSKADSVIDFDGANLSGVDLKGADLRQVNLAGATLVGADLRNSNLREAILRNADLSSARLEWSQLRYAMLVHADLKGAALRHCDLTEADLSHCDLSGADLRQTVLIAVKLQEAYLWDCDLRHANLRSAFLDQAVLSHTMLGSSDLSGASLHSAYLDESDLTGVDLSGAKLDGTVSTRANLEGASGWTLSQLGSAKHDATIMPDGQQLIGSDGNGKQIVGPTIDEWMSGIMRVHGGNEESRRLADGSVF